MNDDPTAAEADVPAGAGRTEDRATAAATAAIARNATAPPTGPIARHVTVPRSVATAHRATGPTSGPTALVAADSGRATTREACRSASTRGACLP